MNVYGGFARVKGVDADVFSMIACHEMGHHLGGYPYYDISPFEWASAEGQADYFATLKCFQRILEKDNNEAAIVGMTIPQLVSERCEVERTTKNDIALCKRSAMAGLKLGFVLESLSGRPALVSLETPDQNIVTQTELYYTSTQCRVDTYFNGAVCGVPFTEYLGIENPTIGSCSKERGHALGFRPSCWYASARQ